ncbi:MAG: ATP-binding cassette domain-containing protein [Bacteroidetes bacterium]|nr:ATP-binding cassette domain-containing protein [Bacteroidota bacterium]
MTNGSDIAIRLENVSKTFYIRDKKPGSVMTQVGRFFTGDNLRKIEAVKNVSIEIKKGDFIGIVGANGSGKSTLLQLMSGVFKPDKGGYASINGKFIRLTLGLGFNQEMTARENVYLNASIMGLTLKEIGKEFNRIIRFAELEKFVDTKIKYFSRGMRARLAFAVAIYTNAEIILLDEFFGGVGDEKFREKSDRIFHERILANRTIVLVSHNLLPIKDHANKVLLMHEGQCVATGTPEEVFLHYKTVLKVDQLKIEGKE